MASGQRKDPYAAFRFHVEINGLVVGGFTEVSGLQAETEVEEYREGGINGYTRKFIKGTKYPNLTLKHGITDVDELWEWYSDVINGTIERRNVFIFLTDHEKNNLACWSFTNAYPVKWVGPDLKADSNTIAVESIEFVHEGFAKV